VYAHSIHLKLYVTGVDVMQNAHNRQDKERDRTHEQNGRTHNGPVMATKRKEHTIFDVYGRIPYT